MLNSTLFKQNDKKNINLSEISRYVQDNNLHDIKTFVNLHNLSSNELNTIIDCYGQNLLHLAVNMKNKEMVEYFLEKNINYCLENKFGETPYGLSLQKKEIDIVEKIMLYKFANDNLYLTKINELLEDNKLLVTKNKDLNKFIIVKKIDEQNLNSENLELKKSNKRMINEIDNCESLILKIKSENLELKSANKKYKSDINILTITNNDITVKNKLLKSSIENLMTNTKK